ncbi:Zn-dependent hydrolase [Vicingaceae bacterium]|nr:Zn-dependent hydrolase [Vicingaceae bacterium]
MNRLVILSIFTLIVVAQTACNQSEETSEQDVKMLDTTVRADLVEARPEIYAKVKLTTDISVLSENEQLVLPYLIKAAKLMDEIFWEESIPESVQVDMASLTEEQNLFYDLNYGPWDRLDNFNSFVNGVGEKPLGANFYPAYMTKEEFESMTDVNKKSLYAVVRRNEEGKLITIPFHQFFDQQLKAADLLDSAAAIATDEELKKYLSLRAKALRTDEYDESDIAWLNMQNNTLDLIVGPIENYEDRLFGYKAAHEAYVLVKDKVWSAKLAKYVTYLEELQENLPVDPTYKAEKPGTDAQLNAYDVVYYAGDCNGGSKTIAVNLPNDETIQKTVGTRRSQLKNAMRAKFDQILLPISEVLIDSAQRKHITFDAFFANTMFHEVAHGLGVKNTIDGKQTVREALKEKYSALEEGKADILGLYMIHQLHGKKVYTDGELIDNYVTFMASIFRSVRFGAASAHGQANMVRFNFFKEKGAFVLNENGTYAVAFDKMTEAMNELSAIILKLQGDGDYDGVVKLLQTQGGIDDQLKADLEKLNQAGIPVDIYFEQGVEALGLN